MPVLNGVWLDKSGETKSLMEEGPHNAKRGIG